MQTKNIGFLAGLLLVAGCSGKEGGVAPGARGNAWLAKAIEEPEFRQACEESPGCLEGLDPDPGPYETIWRVQVVHDGAGTVTIGDIDSVDVLRDDGIPLGKASGDFLLVGVDEAGEAVDGQLIRFPRTLRVEFENGSPAEVGLAGLRVDTVGYLRADRAIRTIEIRDEAEAVVASRSTQDILASRQPPGVSLFGFASPAYALMAPTGLPSHCSHVRVLQGEVDREHAGPILFGALERLAEEGAIGEVRLVPPSGPHLAQVVAALNRMTPLLCSGISRIAFADFPEMSDYAAGAVLFAGEGETIMINTASYTNAELADLPRGVSDRANRMKPIEKRRLQLQVTLTHEAGHAVEALLNSMGSYNTVYGGDWGIDARSKAKAALDNARLHRGFGLEWRRLHDSFVDAGWAKDYAVEGLIGANPIFDPAQEYGIPEDISGPRNLRLPDNQVVDGGFMTSYGSNVWWDDIAEFISEIYLAPVLRSKSLPTEDLACLQMQALGEPQHPVATRRRLHESHVSPGCWASSTRRRQGVHRHHDRTANYGPGLPPLRRGSVRADLQEESRRTHLHFDDPPQQGLRVDSRRDRKVRRPEPRRDSEAQHRPRRAGQGHQEHLMATRCLQAQPVQRQQLRTSGQRCHGRQLRRPLTAGC